MTTLETTTHSHQADIDSLNERISRRLDSANPLMSHIVMSLLRTKGKQLRPLMLIMCAKIFGQVSEKVLAAASAVELLHNASLIHDDVVDDTVTRRGSSTINGTWDNHLAVLVGDFFLSNALLQSVATNDIRVVKSISDLGRLLSIGELDEIYTARYNNLDEESYFQIIYRKTASLFVSCVEVGAYGVEVDDDRLDTLREFARLLGLCFQIKDDIFDYFSDEKIGKPTGNDLREGKITLPLLHALKNGSPRSQQMAELAQAPHLDPAQVNELISFAIEEGGIDYAYATMRRLRDQAAELLKRFPDNEQRRALLSLIDFIITREN